MLAKTALLVLAALAASVSTAEAGVGNLNLAARVNPAIPKPPNLGPHLINTRIKLHCHYVRERNELGVWERRTYCH